MFTLKTSLTLKWENCKFKFLHQSVLFGSDYTKAHDIYFNCQSTPTPRLTWICFTQISQDSHSAVNTYYETEIPSLPHILLDFVWPDMYHLTWLQGSTYSLVNRPKQKFFINWLRLRPPNLLAKIFSLSFFFRCLKYFYSFFFQDASSNLVL